MEMQFKLEVFEGPLDLLLHLIEKNKVNIYDIPIAEITDQYLEYIDEMKRQDLNVMSEFLVMAATLLNIKSKMLLPKEEVEVEEEEDPRAELVQQLLEYKMYKTYAYELRDRQVDADQIFYKVPTIPDEVLAYEEPVDVDELISDLTLNKLNLIFQSVLKREKSRVDPVRSRFGEIKKEEVSLEEKMEEILSFARAHKTFSFRELLERQSSRVQIVVTFLVILEMMKAGEIHIVQEKIFDDIRIESRIAA
ncbi:MAG: segregation/condensation protein A [Lachnospiraceae bacterium]|nr:segregation/condensation protein A [Lachnospiraceae bacterium]